MIVKTIDLSDGRKLEICHDDDPQNPRDWDNMGTMAFFHSHYDLGDKGHGLNTNDFGGWDEMLEWIAKKMDGAIILPVRMYDHSGIAFAMGADSLRYPFDCRWDSMQVGFIFVTKAKLIAEYSSDDDEAKAKAMTCLQAELEVYNQYHGGDVWGFQLRGSVCEECGGKGEVEDSCWGFFGNNPITNGIVDHLDAKYRGEIEAMV